MFFTWKKVCKLSKGKCNNLVDRVASIVRIYKTVDGEVITKYKIKKRRQLTVKNGYRTTICKKINECNDLCDDDVMIKPVS